MQRLTRLTFVALALVWLTVRVAGDARVARAGQVATQSWDLPGIPGPPLVAPDGTVYIGAGRAHYDSSGSLSSISPNGALNRRLSLDIVPGSSRPALLPDGGILVHGVTYQSGCQIGCIGVEKLYAINANGTQRWVYLPNASSQVFVSEHPATAAVTAGGIIYLGALNTSLHALNADGTLRWADSPSVSTITATPALAPNGRIYVTDASGLLVAYEPDGQRAWSHQFPTTQFDQSPIAGPDSAVYIMPPDALVAFNADGTHRWTFTPQPGDECALPFAPTIGGDGTIYIACGTLYAINPNGTMKWRFAAIASWPAYRTTPVIGADGTILWNAGGAIHAVDGVTGTRIWWRYTSTDQNRMDPRPATGADGRVYIPVWRDMIGQPDIQRLEVVTGLGAVPPVPQNLRLVSSSSSSVQLAWDLLAYYTSMQLVWTRSSPLNYVTVNRSANDTSYTLAALTAGVTYYAHVRACGAAGCSAWSGGIAFTPGESPALPGGLHTVASSPAQIDIGWTDTSSFETAIQVAWTPAAPVAYAFVNLPAGSIAWSHTGVTVGATYFYHVRACAGTVCSAWTPGVVATAADTPAAPANVRAGSLTGGAVPLLWDDVATAESDYQIAYTISAPISYTFVSLPAGTTAWSHTSAVAGESCYYHVRACTGVNCSAWSGAVAITNVVPPAPPSGLDVSAVTSTSVDVIWNDNASSETAYDIAWTRSSPAAYTTVRLPAATTSWTLMPATPNTTYYVHVRACTGFTCTAWSAALVVTTSAVAGPLRPAPAVVREAGDRRQGPPLAIGRTPMPPAGVLPPALLRIARQASSETTFVSPVPPANAPLPVPVRAGAPARVPVPPPGLPPPPATGRAGRP